jgi:hypothetical protein
MTWKLKEQALDSTLNRTRFGSGCGPVVRKDYRMVGHFAPEDSPGINLTGSCVGVRSILKT